MRRSRMLRKLVFLALTLPLFTARAQSSGDDSSETLRFTTGVTAGALHFPDGRTQQGASAVVRWHPAAGISLAVTPSFTRIVESATPGNAARTGLSDLPVELTFDH